ncbi:MAG: GNAT family protein, partial [Bacteroidota bacterium]
LGKGYATEAVMALTKVGFEIEMLERIEIHCHPNNLRSLNIPRKLGYVNEATLRDRSIDSYGEKRDVMIWTMFKSDYFASELRFTEIAAFDVVNEQIELKNH